MMDNWWWLVLGCWWLVVMVRDQGVGMRQKMSGAAAVAILLLHWKIMIGMID